MTLRVMFFTPATSRAGEADARRFGDGHRVFVLFGVVAVVVAVDAGGAGLVVALRDIGKRRQESHDIKHVFVVKFGLFSLTAALL
jgi:hypothetical protein